ncbi:MAG: PQQ-binding-like beta-propeller repeat protein [Acidobacteriota bacterium]|nr:PQQ-binding-like beta-propeller repeat protein [Acidobacteriota bacterium]
MLSHCILFLSLLYTAADSPQFRGPQRNGIFPETGLLKKWPDAGPRKDWTASGLGKGYSSVSVVDGKVYTTGIIGKTGYLFALSATDGKQIYKVAYGAEHDGSGYEGARSTPTIVDGKAYLISGLGVVSCFEAETGKKLWTVDTLKRFGGNVSPGRLIPRWAITESLLVDGNKLICTPGAPNATVVALDKDSGDTIWTSKGLSDLSGYCSPRILENGNIRQLVTMTARQLVGIDLDSGKVLWKTVYKGSYEIHANSPVFNGNDIYVTDGYGQGGAMFRLSEDGKKISKLWTEKLLDVHHGGCIVLDGKIYGADSRGVWMSLDAETGKVIAKGRGVGKGSIIYADGLIYGYGERGRVGIIDPKAGELEPISTFSVNEGSGQHWAHPVISRGFLYIRRGDAMMRYDIRAD